MAFWVDRQKCPTVTCYWSEVLIITKPPFIIKLWKSPWAKCIADTIAWMGNYGTPPLSGQETTEARWCRLSQSVAIVFLEKATSSKVEAKMKRGQDIRLSICSYVAEKPCGCLYQLTCCNAKFHSLFKCKLYLWINFIYHSKVLE